MGLVHTLLQAIMEDEEVRSKSVAIYIHVCNMIVNIPVVLSSNVPYSSLFEWLTDISKIYAYVVIFFEIVTLTVHLVQCCQRAGNKHCHCANSMDVAILCLLCGTVTVHIVLYTVTMEYVHLIHDGMDDDLYKEVTELYGLPDRLSITETINDLQRHEECCGVYDYVDYYNSTYANLPTYSGRVVPLTCYRIPEEGINAGQVIDESKIYDTGCLEALLKVYDDYFRRIWYKMITSVLSLVDTARVILVILKKCNNKVADASAVRNNETEGGDPEAHPEQMETPMEVPEGTSSSNDKHLPPLQYRSVKRFIAPDSSTTGQRKETPAGKLKTRRVYDLLDNDSLVAQITSEKYFI